jgi:hypothetical protein
MRKKEKINLFQIKIPKKAMMTNSKMKMERKSKMKSVASRTTARLTRAASSQGTQKRPPTRYLTQEE